MLASSVYRNTEARTGIELDDVYVHRDLSAQLAAALLGAHAFTRGNHVFLGPTVGTAFGPSEDATMKHELLHVAQVRLGTAAGLVSSSASVEREAKEAADHGAGSVDLSHGASAAEIYGLWWLLPLAAAAYVLLRPNVANAPGPGDPTYPSVSEVQVAGEAFALFFVPTATYGIATRVGLGFYASSALAGSSATVSLRGVEDISRGEFSGVGTYLVDAGTGAVIGIVVPGGIRLVGRAGTTTFDWLATQGMRRSDIAVTRLLAERAAAGPLSAGELAPLLQPRGWTGRASNWWLNRRGMIVLYRGQAAPSREILSPLAREQGISASEAMVARMRAAGLPDEEIAGYVARWHTQPVPEFLVPPGLGGQPLGAVGIPTTRLPGIAAQPGFGAGGVVYVIRVPQGTAIQATRAWQGLVGESEWIILNQAPPGSIVGSLPASRVPALTIDEVGRLVPAR